MTAVREAMTAEPTVFAPDTPVVDVAKAMEAGDMGAVVVCDPEGRPLGMVTDRDLAVEVLGAGRDPSQTTVGDILLGTAVATVDQDDTMEEAVKVMKERAVRRVPVVSNGAVVGLLSQADVARVDDALAGELVEVLSEARDNTARG